MSWDAVGEEGDPQGIDNSFFILYNMLKEKYLNTPPF